jgi:hypothetical protein
MTAVLLAAVVTDSSRAQEAAPTARDTAYLDSVFSAHRYPVEIKGGRLVGPGARFLQDATPNVQFFVIGESHYVAQIPGFASAIFNQLHTSGGFDHYAIELGPAIGRMLSAPRMRGQQLRTFDLARHYPHAFQFWDDEELKAIADIGRQSRSKTDAIWGIDNEWGAVHILDRLAAIAPNNSARREVTALADQARVLEMQRPFDFNVEIKRFITTPDSAALIHLKKVFRPEKNTEAAFLIDALVISNRIYRDNGAANRGAFSGYEANSERERYMKDLFMDEYRKAQRRGESLPRVLVKIGSVHGGKWLSPYYVDALGNFLHEVAISNSRESFHLVAWLVNEPGTYWSITDDPAFQPLSRAGSTRETVIVDLRPMRDLWVAGRLKAMSPDMMKWVFGYDAVLLIGSGTRGSYDQLRGTALMVRP